MLTLVRQWSAEGRAFVRWSAASQAVLRRLKWDLGRQLKGVLSPRCAHVRGCGGVKGAVRHIDRRLERYPFVARFDIRSYYENMDHAVLLGQLRDAGIGLAAQAAVREYLAKPDLHATGKGMAAGGAISPLLGALYLTPLDRVMQLLELRLGIFYQRTLHGRLGDPRAEPPQAPGSVTRHVRCAEEAAAGSASEQALHWTHDKGV